MDERDKLRQTSKIVLYTYWEPVPAGTSSKARCSDVNSPRHNKFSPTYHAQGNVYHSDEHRWAGLQHEYVMHWQGHSSQTYKCSSYSKLLIMWHDCEQVIRATRHVGFQQRAKQNVTSFCDSRQTNTPGNHIHLVENCHSLNKASQAQASEHEQWDWPSVADML